MDARVEMSGFRDIDDATKDVLQKKIGRYVEKFTQRCQKFEQLKLTLKTVHAKEKGEKYELHGRLFDNGKTYLSIITDRNLVLAVEKALEILELEMQKGK